MTAAIAAPAAPTAASTSTPASGAPKGATETPAGELKPNATPSEPKPLTQAQKIKLKLRGKKGETEREMTPAEIERELQIADHERGQRAEHLRERQEHEARIKRLTEDPDGFLDEIGFDFDAYAERRAAQQQQLKALTPEQRRIRELEDSLGKREAADKKAAAAAEQQRIEQQDSEFVASNAKLYGDTMTLAGIKRGERGAASFLSHMATVRHMAHVNGEPDLSPDQLLAHTERYEQGLFDDMLTRKVANEGWRGRNGAGLQSLAKSLLSTLSTLEGDALLSWMGRDNALRVTKALHAKTRTSPVPIVQDTPRAEAPPAPPNGAKTVTGWDEAADRFGF